MDKDYLSKCIQRRAEDKKKEMWHNFQNLIERDPVGCRIKLTINGKEFDLRSLLFYTLKDKNLTRNNEEVDKQLQDIFEERETNEILNRLDNIKYIFNQE